MIFYINIILAAILWLIIAHRWHESSLSALLYSMIERLFMEKRDVSVIWLSAERRGSALSYLTFRPVHPRKDCSTIRTFILAGWNLLDSNSNSRNIALLEHMRTRIFENCERSKPFGYSKKFASITIMWSNPWVDLIRQEATANWRVVWYEYVLWLSTDNIHFCSRHRASRRRCQ